LFRRGDFDLAGAAYGEIGNGLRHLVRVVLAQCADVCRRFLLNRIFHFASANVGIATHHHSLVRDKDEIAEVANTFQGGTALVSAVGGRSMSARTNDMPRRLFSEFLFKQVMTCSAVSRSIPPRKQCR
jgi:hypothetical protein